MFRVIFILGDPSIDAGNWKIIGEAMMPSIPRSGEYVDKESLDIYNEGVLLSGQSLKVQSVTHGKNPEGWYHSVVVLPGKQIVMET